MNLSRLLIAGAILLGCSLAVLAWRAMVRHEAKRLNWDRPKWWQRPVDGPGLRLSVRPMGDPSQAEVHSVCDVRLLSGATRSPKRMRRVP